MSVVRCGKVAGHDGPHLTVTGQDRFVEWQTISGREGTS